MTPLAALRQARDLLRLPTVRIDMAGDAQAKERPYRVSWRWRGA